MLEYFWKGVAKIQQTVQTPRRAADGLPNPIGPLYKSAPKIQQTAADGYQPCKPLTPKSLDLKAMAMAIAMTGYHRKSIEIVCYH